MNLFEKTLEDKQLVASEYKNMMQRRWLLILNQNIEIQESWSNIAFMLLWNIEIKLVTIEYIFIHVKKDMITKKNDAKCKGMAFWRGSN